MLSHNELKFLRSLKQKKVRKEYGCFIVEGTKSVWEVLHSDFHVKAVYATPQWMEQHPKFYHDIHLVSTKECEQISALTTTPHIFALVEMLDEQRSFSASDCKKILILDDIKDAGNFGTIIRTADWFGMDAIICSENTVELYNPKTLQASMGSFTRVPIFSFNLMNFLQKYSDVYTFFGAYMEGEPIGNVNFPQYSAIVLGSESFGISPQLSAEIKNKISIPMGNSQRKRSPESLNVSLAAAIVCYELAHCVKCASAQKINTKT